MNDTKWNEIFKAFFYGIECSEDEKLSNLQFKWTTKSLNGFIYSDTTWSHFRSDSYKDIDWLKIDTTEETKEIVIDVLRKINVPGEILYDCVYVYGYRTDVDYI